MSDCTEEICFDCNLVNAVCDLLDQGRPIAGVWEQVKNAIEQWEDE